MFNFEKIGFQQYRCFFWVQNVKMFKNQTTKKNNKLKFYRYWIKYIFLNIYITPRAYYIFKNKNVIRIFFLKKKDELPNELMTLIKKIINKSILFNYKYIYK